MKDLSESYEFSSKFNEKYSIETRRILRILSENSRASVSEMSTATGLSRRSVAKKLKIIEKTFGIKYTLELNQQAVGAINPYLIVVKFKKKPERSELLRLMASSSVPQVVALTKGDYQMIVYANAPTSGEYVHWDRSMQILLSEYGVSWSASQVVHRQLGFFPIRNELLERLSIPVKYIEMLKLLNENSRASFQSMAKELGMHFNTVAYNFAKLVKLGYIKRFTISIQQPKEVELMSFFAKYAPTKGYEESSARARKAFTYDDKESLISRYLICSQTIGSYDFFTLGTFDDYNSAYHGDIAYHRYCLKNHGMKMVHATIEAIILGNLPIRSMDDAKTYDTIRWNPIEIKPKQK